MIPLPKPRLSRASTRLFEETIVFTHHFGGHGASTKRHQDFVNELGYDCVSFTLTCDWQPSYRAHLREIWKTQLRHVLDEVAGPKILYTFSSPSITTADILANEPRADIRAWICDGGPFLETFHCLKNYYREQTRLPAWGQWAAATVGYFVIGGWGLPAAVREWMKNISPEIGILSIRAGQDKLVPEHAIDAFFASGDDLHLEKFELPSAEHLEGLKNFPSEYKPRVKEFLLPYSRAIKV